MPANNADLIIGRHPVMAALKAKQTANKLFVQEKLQADAVAQIVKLAKQQGIIVSSVPKTKLDQLTDHQNHQGVILTVAAFEYADVATLMDKEFIVVLANIEDPHNLGSIMRTADAAGVDGIIIPKRRAVQLTSTVAKTSTGAIEYVPVARVTNLAQTIDEMKKAGFWVFGTDMDGTDYRKWNATGKVALIIGNEGKGIPPLLKQKCDEMLTIPMMGHVQSLNASVAASLLIYQGFTSRGH